MRVYGDRPRIGECNGVAIGRGLRTQCSAETALCAAAVVDYNLLLPQLAQFRTDDATYGVSAAARRRGHDPADRTARKSVGGDARCRYDCACRHQRRREFEHDHALLLRFQTVLRPGRTLIELLRESELFENIAQFRMQPIEIAPRVAAVAVI